MNIEKVFLADLERAYCTSETTIDGRKKLIIASEGKASCLSYDVETLEKTVVWEDVGGTMSIVPIPNKNGDFLAVQRFYSGFNASDTRIVHVSKDNNEFKVNELFALPFVHRFDILTVGDINYFIGCTLCTSKTDKEDWSDPGKIYVGIIPDDLTSGIKLSVIKDGLTKNHGYSRAEWNGKLCGMVTSEEGLFAVYPPDDKDGEWSIETILKRPISDVAILDIDGDGNDEIATIEQFHGNKFIINKKNGDTYDKVYEKDIEFGHVVYATTLRGKPTFIGAERAGNMDLFYIQSTDGGFKTEVIERGAGASNVYVINDIDKDIILSANRQVHQAVLYYVR